MFMKPHLQLSVFDTEQLEDITYKVEKFEFEESKNNTSAWITIDGLQYGLLPKREPSKNKIYAIRITDNKDNEIYKMMEVSDTTIYGLVPKWVPS